MTKETKYPQPMGDTVEPLYTDMHHQHMKRYIQDNMETLFKMMVRAEYGGEKIYIPRATRATRIQWVKQRYDGSNASILAYELGVSLRSIYRYIQVIESSEKTSHACKK